ncbi:MAG: hypothetical protein V8Q88_00440 [Christensenellales bacterium]
MGEEKEEKPRTKTSIEIIKLLTAMTMLVKAIVDLELRAGRELAGATPNLLSLLCIVESRSSM